MAKAKRRKKPVKKRPDPKTKYRGTIDPRTGLNYRNPTVKAAEDRGEPVKPLMDPKTGRFLPGNPTAYHKGQPKSGPGRGRQISHSYRRLLAKQIPEKLRKRILNADRDVIEFCDGLAYRVATIAMIGSDRYAIMAAAEIRQATEGSRIQHAKDDWKEELEALGLDPDDAMQRIEALLSEMVDEANAKRMADVANGEHGEEHSSEETGSEAT
jgi:hypothetical protein